jgi:hypothetical protein
VNGLGATMSASRRGRDRAGAAARRNSRLQNGVFFQELPTAHQDALSIAEAGREDLDPLAAEARNPKGDRAAAA